MAAAALSNLTSSVLDEGFLRTHIKGIGRLFYLNSPEETTFEKVSEIPNYYVQCYPYFILFLLLEHIVLKLEGRPGIRLNDGITSISNGILYEIGKLAFRGVEAFLYTWIYTNWRLVELPWDNPLTWYAALLGVDFCYYWMHRACHEVAILWAQHQVHHTSEDFNMGVGIRQSVAQGWFGFIFYLPLALLIPPTHFMVHQQLSLLYMFWIHTEAIGTLGPLEYIFNTPSAHRVHHGCNLYCLDVNYGGLLIIWDRIFGTHRLERDKEQIIYGLLVNRPSFNPINLQTFYTPYIVGKSMTFEKFGDKVRTLLYGPSWVPGSPRLGKDEDKIDVREREKYDVVLPTWWNVYLVSHYALVLYGFHEFVLKYYGMSPISAIVFVSYIIASLTIIGILFEGNQNASIYEALRCAVLAFCARRVVAYSWMPWAVTALQVFYVVSAMFWSMYYLKLVELKKKESIKTE